MREAAFANALAQLDVFEEAIMSAALPVIVQPAYAKRSEALLRLPGELLRAIARYFARRAAIDHLRELDEPILQDIGLARSEIEAAVQGRIPRSNRGRM